MIKTTPRLTASQVILLAGDDLMAQGASEFTEWDLTMASWIRDRDRFGLRGYSQDHPDHKRVAMEIMGKKPHNPVILGQMVKVRPNTYRLTPAGRLAAQSLRNPKAKPPPEPKPENRPKGPSMYDGLAGYVAHLAFVAWQEDPDLPRQWETVADFLGCDSSDHKDARQRVKVLRARVRAAMDFCNRESVDYLGSKAAKRIPPIHFNTLAALLDFLSAMTYRFEQLEGK